MEVILMMVSDLFPPPPLFIPPPNILSPSSDIIITASNIFPVSLHLPQIELPLSFQIPPSLSNPVYYSKVLSYICYTFSDCYPLFVQISHSFSDVVLLKQFF